MRTLLVPAIILSVVPIGGAHAADVVQHRILLQSDYSLEISDDVADKSVTVALAYGGQNTISVRVENAGFTLEEAVQVKLCTDCDPVRFLPVWDASSTYGAITGIIAWPNGPWWSLSILPLSRPAVEDLDGDGVFDLVDYTISDGQLMSQRYTFESGMLAPTN